MAYWAALRTRANCEKRVIVCLGDLGFETYFPTVMVDLKRRSRRWVEVEWASVGHIHFRSHS
jgi:hypothetical protein